MVREVVAGAWYEGGDGVKGMAIASGTDANGNQPTGAASIDQSVD